MCACGMSGPRPSRTLRPSAASPIVPVTYRRSPGLTPVRLGIRPCATAPIAVTLSVNGPGVATVSPPRRGHLKAMTSAPRPSAKAASHSSLQSDGSASASRNPSGRAALAARSERLTRNALRAIAPGGSSAKKWTPATRASVVSTRSSPGGGRISAASSRRPKPAGPASGAKYRAMRSASPRRGDMESANPEGRANDGGDRSVSAFERRSRL